MTSTPSILCVVGDAARNISPRIGLAGSLREHWTDAEAVAWLRHMAGLPAPIDDPVGAFTWHTEGNGARLALDSPVLGIHVRGVDTVALAEGVEALGDMLSAVTPAAMAEAETTGTDFESLLPIHLKRAVISRVGQWPPGVSYAPAEGPAEARPRSLDTEGHRQAQATLEVQDHRSVIPIRAR